MEENRLKVDVADLALGMYVAELDRPWLETSFLLQGFEISDADDLAELQKTCRYVIVDTERSSVDCRQHLLARPETQQAGTPPLQPRSETPVSQPSPQERRDFRKELPIAKSIRDQARGYLMQTLNKLRLGSGIDVRQAQQLVSHLAESVMRNDHALVWLTQLKARDEYTVTHCLNTCILALSFGRYLGLDRQELLDLGLGALLQDLGKMKIPQEVLNKPGRLTEEEFELVRQHPVQAYQALSQEAGLSEAVLNIVRHHHERLDGKGYPDQLPDLEIPRLTRIAAIADVYDALTSDRVYHDGITPHEALRNMLEGAAGSFDPELVEAFIQCLGVYPVGSLVELKSGHVGVVVTFKESNRLKPSVLLILDRDKQPFAKRILVNLGSSRWQTEKHPPEISRVLEPDAHGVDLPVIIEAECIGQ